MAKKMKRLLALVMALALCAGQLAVPASALENEQQEILVTVEVVDSQAPEATDDLTVTEEAPVTTETRNPESGETVTTTSTTTNWSGTDENGAAVEGTETESHFTGTNENGDVLYEGGSLEGEQTTTTTETTESTSRETLVTEEVTTNTETETKVEESTSAHTTQEESREEGQWDTTGEVTEGTFVSDRTETSEESETLILGDGEIPEGGITIELTPNQTGEGFSGEATGEVVFLTEEMEIPEGAELVYDEENNLIGYRFRSQSSEITGSTEVNGQATNTGGTVDNIGTTAAATPDLEEAAQALNIPITGESVITEEHDPEDESKVTAYVVTNTTQESGTMDAPEEMEKPEAGETVLENGNVQTITLEDLTDENGNVIGYVARTIISDGRGNLVQDSTTTQIITRNDPPQPAEPVVTFTLPEKPAESTRIEADGTVTAVTVTDILDENGQVVGYEEVTIQTDAQGNELSRETRQLLGTTETVTEGVEVGDAIASGTYSYTKTIVDTYRVTAEETMYQDIETYTRLTDIVNEMTVSETWQIVEINGSLYYIYAGSMDVSEGEGHGDTSQMVPITPMDHLMNKNGNLDLDDGYTYNVNSGYAPDSGFRYLGYGVNSDISVNKSNGSTTNVAQFRLKAADGKEYYAHCIDFSTTIVAGHLYDIRDIENESYYQQTGTDKSAAEIIRLVALNGYWGTESGVGSMEDVQAFLLDYLTGTASMSERDAQAIVNSLTPGQAQAATQAALWEYGNKNNTSLKQGNLFTGDDTDERNAKYLYEALLAAATDSNARPEENEGVEFLDAADVTGGAITINSKVAASEENGYAENLYSTDLSFTLGIEPAKLNGDLVVTVTVGDEEIKRVRLAGADDPLLPMGRIVKNEDGSYTIPDVQIAEGVSVNLNLSGTQNLGTGVYIFTSMTGDYEASQTLVTLASGERKVNLDMNMEFSVEEPTAEVTRTEERQYGTRTDHRTDTKNDVITRVETTTSSEYDRTEYTSGSGTRTSTAMVTITRVSVEETEEKNSWYSDWIRHFEIGGEEEENPNPNPDPAQGDGIIPEETVPADGTIRIPDEAVPLANAPRTGDISILWAVISLVSLAGMVLLAKKRETV